MQTPKLAPSVWPTPSHIRRTDKKDSMKERLESLDKSRQLAARKILT
jgi:hypothetical protein